MAPKQSQLSEIFMESRRWTLVFNIIVAVTAFYLPPQWTIKLIAVAGLIHGVLIGLSDVTDPFYDLLAAFATTQFYSAVVFTVYVGLGVIPNAESAEMIMNFVAAVLVCFCIVRFGFTAQSVGGAMVGSIYAYLARLIYSMRYQPHYLGGGKLDASRFVRWSLICTVCFFVGTVFKVCFKPSGSRQRHSMGLLLLTIFDGIARVGVVAGAL